MTFRPDPKPDPKPKKVKTAIRKITPEKKQERDEMHEQDDIFYHEIWNERPHKCEICGKKLTYFSFSWFHHLLRKGEAKFAHLRYERKNIAIVCQEHHDQFHWANPPFVLLGLVNAIYEYFESEGKIK